MATLREPATLFEAALGRLVDVLTPGSLLEATPESLVVAESGGEIVYANSACERLTGFSRGELLGQIVTREDHKGIKLCAYVRGVFDGLTGRLGLRVPLGAKPTRS